MLASRFCRTFVLIWTSGGREYTSVPERPTTNSDVLSGLLIEETVSRFFKLRFVFVLSEGYDDERNESINS
jgi:hypothetical protein